MKKRYTTYETHCKLPLGGSLWGLLFFFIFTACQDEIPNDTTEVMMTFTTRAFVGAVQGDTVSTHLNEEKMKDLRVIMVRENGEIVGNHKEEGINQTSVTFTFRTPVKTGGENFTFFAIANEGSITPVNNGYLNRAEGNSYSSDELSSFKALQIGNSAFTLSESQPIPQTKQWTIKVPQQDTKIDNQRLEYVASKISVEFHNKTNKSQTLKNIKLTGIPSTTSGYLFKQETDDFVGTQQDASDIVLVGEEGMTLSVAQSDSVKYYTYPVGTLSSPTLYATWNGTQYDLPIEINDEFITSLPRNQHLKIIVTLTGQELTVNYTIAPWEEHATNIGGTSPTPEGGYVVKDWDDGNDVVIGDEPEQEEPDTPVVPGDVIWSKTLNLTLTGSIITHSDDFTTEDESYFVAGRTFGMSIEYIPNNWGAIVFMERGKGWDGKIPTFAEMGDRDDGGITITGNCTIEFVLTQTDVEMILRGNGVEFWGNGVTITQIYIKSPSTQ